MTQSAAPVLFVAYEAEFDADSCFGDTSHPRRMVPSAALMFQGVRVALSRRNISSASAMSSGVRVRRAGCNDMEFFKYPANTESTRTSASAEKVHLIGRVKRSSIHRY